MKDISFENIGLSCGAEANNPSKQIHFISGVAFVVIAKPHAQRLGISDETETWVEQLPIEGGILLRVRKNHKDRFLPSKNCVGKFAENQTEGGGT